MPVQNRSLEYALLGCLALLWGSSYMWISLALETIPPATLIAIRVALACAVLLAIMAFRGIRMPLDKRSWWQFFVQSLVNSTGPWLLLAWGQQYAGTAVSSVLNSTSPLWVFALSYLLLKSGQRPGRLQFTGAMAGFCGIVLIVGVGALEDIGQNLLPQLAVLFSAVLYGFAALRGRVFSGLPPIVSAIGTLLCSCLVLIPMSLIADRPWQLEPDLTALGAAAILGIACTALAFLIYFRLLRTLGPMGTASQAYLRSGIGVFLGVVFLSETLDLETFAGICLAIFGVVLINWPKNNKSQVTPAVGKEVS
ncbi:DMT family transporter [Roseibium marinum]|uniref:Drug/metabolite transporter (DMT)-like permease n=1 Tax=Roseibium marinum TaxID=281252 RepID=A0A2S3UKQ9_9HYPH|nr:EamA family transporter [Roseibium marinum]POF28143.1 drug/metabolite transporter (DMT)-like permease [Roseibium marinum]